MRAFVFLIALGVAGGAIACVASETVARAMGGVALGFWIGDIILSTHLPLGFDDRDEKDTP